MEIIALIIGVVGLGALGAMVLKPITNGPGRFEAKARPPEEKQSSWMSFRANGGTVHLRLSRIQSISYSLTCSSVTINDGTENPLTIPDPDGRCYERLCRHFGITPMDRPTGR